ncbi:MAG TPA: metallopeptidase family protein [Candidatus Limnocylindrales bacterium]|nr:metallopeptidase family protein [Candidatus Limnocylindrales bacterium]
MHEHEGPAAIDASDDSFAELVVAALERLPAQFRDRLGSVAIVVEDEPTAAQLAATGARGLFGLYEGVPRTALGADRAPIASKITIFRGPLERAYGSPAGLAEAVDDVVRHEIAHHFGIDDARLRELRSGR